MSLLQDLTKILREANAGYNFDDDGEVTSKYYVNPKFNEDNVEYINAREDEIESVLTSSTNLDYTNAVDKYLRLLMPRYKRRVEVEDLNRNFWVISQAIAKISEYLTVGLDVHREVLLLPSDDLHTCVKYDNFDTFPTINGSTIADPEELEQVIFDRLDYLKRSYPNSDLVIIPVIRQGNYYHNYYRREIYLGVYKYNKKEEEATFDWFYNTNGQIAPIISECSGKEDYIFSLNEDQIDLQFYWYYGNNISDLPEDHSRAYVTAFRATPTFENDDSTQIKIVVKDAIGDAIKNAIDCEQVYTEIYTINYTNNKYVWTKETILPIVSETTSGKIEIESKVKGYYLGELSSERGKLIGGTINDYSLSIVEHNLRPISPSYYEIYYILNHLGDIFATRGDTPDVTGTVKHFLPKNGKGDASETGKAIKFYQLLGIPATANSSEPYEPYGQGIENNNYQTYKNVNGLLTLTQHGEDAAALELFKQELQNQGTNNIILHLFNHTMLLQKIEGGTAANKSDSLKNIITVHKNSSGIYEIEKNHNNNGNEFLDDYIVYEYDGYLTGTSQNSSKKTAVKGFKSGFGETTTCKTIDQATPRRDNPPSSLFTSWNYQDTPLELIAVDNGEIATAPSQHDYASQHAPRFSGGLEQFTYGAVLQIPYKTNRSLCYNFEYNFFENALQDSCAFWRGVFELTGKKTSSTVTYEVGNENYGRKHNVYTNAQYFINNNNSKDMIIKITNIGVTFGPSLQYFKNNDNTNPDPYRTDYTQFNNLPTEYQYGFKDEITDNGHSFISDYSNWIAFDETKRKSFYYNSIHQPKHINPLAPVAAYGWPIRSAVDTNTATVYVWENNALTGQNSGNKNPAVINNDKVTIKKTIEEIPSNATVSPNIEYMPLLSKPGSFTKRGYTSSVLPVQYTQGNSRTMKLPDSKFGTIVAKKYNFEHGTKTQEKWTIGTYKKGEDGSTLNEGKYYEGCGQSKYYGMTTIVHTIYVKVDLSNDNTPCQSAICTVKRLNKTTGDYRPNLDAAKNNQLVWNKKWDSSNFTGTPSQSSIETMLSQDYTLKAATGDFVNKVVDENQHIVEQKLIYDFAKYPSNGMCPIQYIDPADLYSEGNGNLTPTTVAPVINKDMEITVSVPDGNEHWGADTISTFQENLVLTDNTLTGTSKYIADTNKHHYIILDYVATDIETGTQIATGQIHFSDCDELTWDHTIPITVTHSGYVTTTKTITVSDSYVFEPAPAEENPPSEENPE